MADSRDLNSLRPVVNNTKVIISTVGPFARYGTKLVALCSAYGTNYCDTTGELDWVKSMIDQYDDLAKESGAKLVSCCAGVSISWDLVTLASVEELKKKSNEEVKSIECFDNINANLSGGTFATILNL